jgi:hypothetical protein
MPVSIDASELGVLAIDLENAAQNITSGEVAKVMRKGAVEIKKNLAREMQSSRHFKGFGRHMDFDETITSDGIEFEIGPNKSAGSGSAAGANIAYFGTSRGGGTVTDPLVTAEAELPAIVGWIEGIADGIL